MVKLEFMIPDEDMERLWAIKDQQGKGNLSGNDFAKELLIAELHKLHPDKVREDEE